MAFFIVSMAHEDEIGWKAHVGEHVAFLQELIAEGTVRASGRLVDEKIKTGCLIMVAKDRADLQAIIARDPFAQAGLISELKIAEWDPLFGLFAAESSGQIPSGE